MAQAILMQGMRRSGTTILYDALLEDPGLHCFYEPFREDTETPGGGSGARETDPFEETRRLRQEYRDHHWPGLDISEFNLGGPGNPEAEIGPDLPEHCAGFLATLLGRSEPVMIKETRFYDKPEDAVLIHVVRDPRAVAASMMMGKNRSRSYASADEFFAETEKRKLWSSRQLSRILLKDPEYSHVRRPANFERILVVWKHTFRSTWQNGRVLFGDRYVLLRNEELRADPVAAIARVYEAAGRPTPPEVAEWARGKVKDPEVPFAANDPRWSEAFARLDMAEALRDAGYGQLAETVGDPPSRRGLRRLLG
jgi:hypothetical protein